MIMKKETRLRHPDTFRWIQFPKGPMYIETELTIGDELVVYAYGREQPNCKFIKVTRKGFNIINLDTNRCLLRQHVYAKGMAHKEFKTKGPITGIFRISEHFKVLVKDVAKMA